jgi:hypothetical protein
MPDRAFASFGLSQHDVARLRERFATWPREPEAVAAGTAEKTSRHPAGPTGQGPAPAAADTAAGQARDVRDARQAEAEEPEIEP